MARSVRDLRELICVSRLTYHGSDEEILSDSDSTLIDADLTKLSLGCSSELGDKDTCARKASISESIKSEAFGSSPDSGFITNSSPPSTSGPQDNSESLASPSDVTASPSLSDGPNSKKPSPPKTTSRHRRKKKKNFKLPPRHYLPKAAPLPPVSKSNESVSCGLREELGHSQSFCFDSMLAYIDADVVTGWLQRANDNVRETSSFCNYQDNFVQFAHFWLSCFPDMQKAAIYEMEYDILLEELNLAFAVGRQAGKVTRKDNVTLLGAIFKEYPGSLLSSKGSHLFLNILDILCSDRTVEYKILLSDVKCSTKNKQYAQWLLASRSFTLVNVWSAVLNFYRNLLGKNPVAGCLPLPSSVRLKNIHQQRMHHAIGSDFVDVVHYLIKEGHVNAQQVDDHGRTWVFTAVMYNCPNVLSYLLQRVKPGIDVNRTSDTGNTALHAAANQGNMKTLQILLETPRISVDCVNPQCEGATPLHLAVMHGHVNIVKALVKAKSDLTLKMGDMTALHVADTFGREEISKFLSAQ